MPVISYKMMGPNLNIAFHLNSNYHLVDFIIYRSCSEIMFAKLLKITQKAVYRLQTCNFTEMKVLSPRMT